MVPSSLWITWAIVCFAPRRMPIKIQPWSTWFAFSLKNTAEVAQYLPSGMEVAPVRILSSDAAEPKLLFNMYRSSSPFFQGLRLEVLTIARRVASPQTTHFVVLDCMSDTLAWDPIDGVHMPDAKGRMSTVLHSHQLECSGDLGCLEVAAHIGKRRTITKSFAVDANHLCLFRSSTKGIELEFNESEVTQDVRVLRNVRLRSDIWSTCRGRMTHAFVHPHAMDFRASLRNFRP